MLLARCYEALTHDKAAEARGVVLPASPADAGAKYGDRETENLLRLFGRIASGSVGPISAETLREYHAAVLDGVATDLGVTPGAYRTQNVRMGASYGADPSEAPGMVDALLRWANDPDRDPLPQMPVAGALLRAITVHTELLEIHPFAEANGRVARAAEFAMLLRAGVPASIAHELHNFYNEDRSAYVQKLRETERGDREAFLRYALEGVNRRLRTRLADAAGGGIARRQLLRAGFTLVELVIVILILGILAGVAAPKLFGITGTAEEAAEQQLVRGVNEGIELYYLQRLSEGAGEYPKTLDDAGSSALCSAATPCFDKILKRGVTDGRWLKTAENTYEAPSGNAYEYDPVSGDFHIT